MKKLWDKGTDLNKIIENFTVGRDRELDLYLAKADVLGSLAHTIMLESVGLLTKSELISIQNELKNIYSEIEAGNFKIEKDVEDIHSQIELLLTQRIGEAGKKIHSARSRNDQILLDLKIFTRSKIQEIVAEIEILFNVFISKSEKHKNDLFPGYTHLQVAMPSSFGLFFGAYAESLTDDLQMLNSAFKITNQNPLGSAAGYGSSFPINRQLTTDLLAFENLNYNVIYAQMGRGKVEKTVAFAMSSVASTLSKMANDLCLYMSQNFGFITLPDQFTTGSSIMPHKKNPDIFEIIRAKSNKIQTMSNEIMQITNNLTSGYFRDMQILKETYIESFDYLIEVLKVTSFIVPQIEIKNNILDDEKYKFAFSVEEVNKLVQKGIPFRKAYQKIGNEINQGNFNPDKEIAHTHEGSIGNLCNDKIEEKFKNILKTFDFEKINKAEEKLLQL